MLCAALLCLQSTIIVIRISNCQYQSRYLNNLMFCYTFRKFCQRLFLAFSRKLGCRLLRIEKVVHNEEGNKEVKKKGLEALPFVYLHCELEAQLFVSLSKPLFLFLLNSCYAHTLLSISLCCQVLWCNL